MKDVTDAINHGSLNNAFKDHQLQKLLYQELRVIAKSKISKNKKQNTLNTTALVHDAFLKINNNSKNKNWHNRRHFYATAAMVMQQILVDAARKKKYRKTRWTFY